MQLKRRNKFNKVTQITFYLARTIKNPSVVRENY